jgi:phosphoribosylaminoimidazole-succinocarboxamide synthase
VPSWQKIAPAPSLPDDVIQQTAARYREALIRLRGHE